MRVLFPHLFFPRFGFPRFGAENEESRQKIPTIRRNLKNPSIGSEIEQRSTGIRTIYQPAVQEWGAIVQRPNNDKGRHMFLKIEPLRDSAPEVFFQRTFAR